jgi:hypothetical protein
VIVRINADKQRTEEIDKMATLAQRALFSWKTSLIGLLSGVYAIAQPFINKDMTFTALIHDQTFILALVGAAIGFLSKDATAHGTPDAPISVGEAQQIAAVAANAPPAASFVGGLIQGTADIYAALPGDPTPVGATQTVAGVKYLKITGVEYQRQKP